jgi:CMP-N,N'-diacetyllegionaminic acid synthase
VSDSAGPVLALVPARGGSKVVPRKNVRVLGGKPLIVWTIKQALAATSVDRVVVSTDDPEIAAVAKQHGAEVPFMRPAELAADDTPDLPVFLHALDELAAAGYRPELAAWLRPTAPLRDVVDIDAAVALLQATGADCVRSICREDHHPFWSKRLEGDRLLPFVEGVRDADFPQRQLLPPAYRLNGAVDVARCASVHGAAGTLFDGDVRGYVMPAARSVDIDSELDFEVAELLITRGHAG